MASSPGAHPTAEESIRLTDAGSRFDYPVRSSPDGSKLLFFRPDAKNETSDSAPQDLFVVGANGKGMTRLTPKGTTTAVVFSYDSVSWSPDGTKVAVAAAKEPFWNTSIHSVYVASADGSSFERVGPRGNIWDAVWSPDGRWIAFSMASQGNGWPVPALPDAPERLVRPAAHVGERRSLLPAPDMVTRQRSALVPAREK